MMDYDIVVATRNRASSLKESVPRFLRQSRPPRRIFIVDSSSEDGQRAKIDGLVREAQRFSRDVDVELTRSPAGSSLQRNIGLKYVESPVVMFPDDDSMWWQATADNMMRVYEEDSGCRIGGVCAREVRRVGSLDANGSWESAPDAPQKLATSHFIWSAGLFWKAGTCPAASPNSMSVWSGG